MDSFFGLAVVTMPWGPLDWSVGRADGQFVL